MDAVTRPIKRLVLPVDKDDFPPDADMPTYPGLVFTHHVALRCAQVGGALGILASPVVWSRARAAHPGKPLAFWRLVMPRTCLRGTVYGGLAGVAVAGGFAAMWDSDDAVVDRGYRLWHSRSQNLVDRFAYGGAFVSGCLGVVVLQASTWLRVFAAMRGSALGLSLGVGVLAAAKAFDPESELWGDQLKE